jgi:hypothetical protein
MPPFPPEVTHQLYARYRFRRNFTLEKCGRIRYEIDPQTGLIVASRALVKLMPVGGFDGLNDGFTPRSRAAAAPAAET